MAQLALNMFPGVAVVTGAGGTGKPSTRNIDIRHSHNKQESAPQLQKPSLQLAVRESLSQTLMKNPCNKRQRSSPQHTQKYGC